MPAPKELVNPLSAQMTRLTLAKLKLQQLPPNVALEVNKKASDIADRLWDVELSKEGLREGRNILQQVSVPAAVKAHLADALTGLQTVSQSQDLAKILTENANMLRAKYNALVAAG